MDCEADIKQYCLIIEIRIKRMFNLNFKKKCNKIGEGLALKRMHEKISVTHLFLKLSNILTYLIY